MPCGGTSGKTSSPCWTTSPRRLLLRRRQGGNCPRHRARLRSSAAQDTTRHLPRCTAVRPSPWRHRIQRRRDNCTRPCARLRSSAAQDTTRHLHRCTQCTAGRTSPWRHRVRRQDMSCHLHRCTQCTAVRPSPRSRHRFRRHQDNCARRRPLRPLIHPW